MEDRTGDLEDPRCFSELHLMVLRLPTHPRGQGDVSTTHPRHLGVPTPTSLSRTPGPRERESLNRDLHINDARHPGQGPDLPPPWAGGHLNRDSLPSPGPRRGVPEDPSLRKPRGKRGTSHPRESEDEGAGGGDPVDPPPPRSVCPESHVCDSGKYDTESVTRGCRPDDPNPPGHWVGTVGGPIQAHTFWS